MSNVASSKFDLTLEIEGIRFPLVYFESSHALNQIPEAMCVLAVGREALGGRTPSPIHAELAQFEKMSVARVLFSARGEYAPGLRWPSGEFVLFEGRVLGLVPQKTGRQIQITAQLVHWLADLDFSSAISGRSHVANPAQYTFEAISDPLLQFGLGPAEPYGLGEAAESAHITDLTIAEDLWGAALKPLFCALARASALVLDSELSLCVGEHDGVNTQALAALARIEGTSSNDRDTDCNLERSAYTPPLALTATDSSLAAPLSVAEAIARSIGRHTIDTFVNQTLWGKLVGELAPMFAFSLVPQVERALVVPFQPGLRQTYCQRIYANDYDFFVPALSLTRPLRALAIVNGYKMETDASRGQAPTYVGLGGCFAPADATLADGLVAVLRSPPWLDGVLSTAYSPSKSGGTRPSTPPSSATTPVEVSEERQGNKDGLSRTDVLLQTKALYDAYARSRYVAEVLRGRTGQLGGKLRFDIAPGATVLIEGTSERFLGATDRLGQSVVASVLRVSTGINAETSKAGTGFLLGHIRTETENASDKTSIERHPLYNTTFTGAPLIPALAFASEGTGCPF